MRLCQSCGRIGEWVTCPACTKANEKSKVALDKSLRHLNKALIALSTLLGIMIFFLTGVFWIVIFNMLGIR